MPVTPVDQMHQHFAVDLVTEGDHFAVKDPLERGVAFGNQIAERRDT
jgi:hypothetical protein